MNKRIGEISFFEKVYQVVASVPYGKITTYGAIAEYLGSKGSSRMVGWALNKSHTLNIPAHRVVNRNGLLTGKNYFGGGDVMKELLEHEGILVIENKIQHFEKYFWNPNEELV